MKIPYLFKLEGAVARPRIARERIRSSASGRRLPKWLICPDCSYMLMEVDFDRAMGIAAG